MTMAGGGGYPHYGGTPPHENVDTSLEAAQRIIPYAATQRLMVLRFIRQCGLMGATQDEMEVVLGIRHSSAGARCCELVKEHLIVQTRSKRTTRSGRWARIYLVSSLVQPSDTPPAPPPAKPPKPKPFKPTPPEAPRARARARNLQKKQPKIPEAQLDLFTDPQPEDANPW